MDDEDNLSEIIPWQGTPVNKRKAHGHRLGVSDSSFVHMESDVTENLISMADQVSTRLQNDGFVSTSSDMMSSPRKSSGRDKSKKKHKKKHKRDTHEQSVSDIDLFPSEVEEPTPKKQKRENRRCDVNENVSRQKQSDVSFSSSRRSVSLSDVDEEEDELSQSLLSSPRKDQSTSSIMCDDGDNTSERLQPRDDESDSERSDPTQSNNKDSSSTLRYCPERGLVKPKHPVTATLFPKYLHRNGEDEFWLVRLPPGVKRQDLESNTISLDGTTELPGLQIEKDFKAQIVAKACPDLKISGLSVFVPNQEGNQFSYAGKLSGQMALTCHLDVPPNVMPFTKPKEKKALPPGLKPRFVPFGSGQPQNCQTTHQPDVDGTRPEENGTHVTPAKHKKKKKKHKNNEESSMETSAYDMAIDASLMDTSTTGDMSSVDTFISSSGRKKKKKKKHKDQLGD